MTEKSLLHSDRPGTCRRSLKRQVPAAYAPDGTPTSVTDMSPAVSILGGKLPEDAIKMDR
jgi:hypothetical protein